MGRLTYVCATCSEHFTRKYSAKRHNQNIHKGAAQIVRLIDYLAGRSSGQYMPDNPFWYKRNNPYHNIGSATVADSIGNTFEPRYIHEQAPLGRRYSANSIYPPRQVMDDQSSSTGLSQDTIVKIDEVRRLMNKNPDGIIHQMGYTLFHYWR
ncbi:MAG: hypothetical protein WBZ36_06835 [Candidatus Nitrosopolaris sp.]